jgi:hypothetical protein
MFALEKMFRRVRVLRVVAAADVPAGEAQAKVHPVIAGLQAVLASVGARSHFADLIEMGACGHG